MFGISFFSNKVANHLFKLGYPASEMPPFDVFKTLCDALKQNGYNAERAANLWFRCLYYKDPDSIRELRDNTGTYGQMIFEDTEI